MAKSEKEGLFEKYLTLTGRNYWKLNDRDLELVASKYHIGEYAGNGTIWSGISRKKIIEQLVFKDKFISALIFEIVSVFALVVSIFALFR